MHSLKKYITDLEFVSCAACGENKTEIFSRRERFGLPLNSVICKSCGLMYINPRPTKRSYERFNLADYRIAVSGTDEGQDVLFNRQRDYAAKKISPFLFSYGLTKPKSLLDIGCANGGIALGIKDMFPNIELHGIEPVEKHADYARRRGVNVFNGLLENFTADRKFDLVIIAQTLNHTLTPKDNLEKVKSLLSYDGVLYISLLDTVTSLLNRPMERMCEMTHPYMFCPENIRYLLSVSGYKTVKFSGKSLDAMNLGKKDIPGLVFERMKLLVEKSDFDRLEKPDYLRILERMKRNEMFYTRWQADIDKWQRAKGWRSLYRALVT